MNAYRPKESRRRRPYQLSMYVRETKFCESLSEEEELALARRVQEGDLQARERMILANLRLVILVARGYVGTGSMSQDDLISEGNMGLIRAVEAFNPDRGVRFSTYASYWIHQTIGRAKKNTEQFVRLPCYMYPLIKAWAETSRRLALKLGEEQAPEAIAKALKLGKKKAAAVYAAYSTSRCSLEVQDPEAYHDSGDNFKHHEHSATWIDHDVHAELEKKDEARVLASKVAKLDPKTASVIAMKFGLNGQTEHNMSQIGRKLGFTREWIRKIEAKGLEELLLMPANPSPR